VIVWILEKGRNYEGFDIVGVFSSREAAVQELERIEDTQQYMHWFDITEWEVT